MAGNVTKARAEHALGEIGSGSTGLRLTQLEYPLLQSLDIEYLDVDLAIGGTDQRKIHMLAREELPELGYDAPTAMHYPLLMSLKGGGRKMSSSNPGTMFSLHADEETIAERIEQAYCPQGMGQVRDDAGKAEAWGLAEDDELLDHNPVLQISKYFVFGADEDLEIERPEEYGGDSEYSDFDSLYEDIQSGELHPQDLKNGVTDYVVDRFEPVRNRFRNQPELIEPLEKIGRGKPEYLD
jgi:tyrosyl-tRNA synthetase